MGQKHVSRATCTYARIYIQVLGYSFMYHVCVTDCGHRANLARDGR